MKNIFKTFLMATSACAMLASHAQSAEVDGPELEWNISLWGKPRAFTVGTEKMAELVNAKTDGNWTITLHYGGALSKSRENLDGLAIEAFEGAMACNFYHPQKNPALMALTMPMLPMSSWDDNRAMRDVVYANPAVIAELARWNAMPYVSSYLPQYELLGRGDKPLTLDDWAGMSVRAGGGVGQAMARLGATPTSSAATEVYTGIQQGTMDAVAFPFTYGHVAYKIHEVADWFTGNLSPGTSDCPVLLSVSAYEDLPDQYQTLLADIKEEVIQAQIQSYLDIDKVNLPMLRDTLEEITYSDEVLAEFRAVAGKPVIEEWIAENEGDFDARGLIEDMFEAVGQTY
mgnify:CR=1 FL=1